MTKCELDKFFIKNDKQITAIIKSNCTKSITTNVCDIKSDIYLICLEKKHNINDLMSYIRIVASNIYRWSNSDYNKKNRLISDNSEVSDTISEDIDEMRLQQLTFLLEKYKLNAKPHELIFYDAYVVRGVRSIRKIAKEFNISRHGAQILINDFKQKIKSYEWENEESESTEAD
jgi:hypothetical protein